MGSWPEGGSAFVPVGADPSFGWVEAAAAFTVIAIVAFLVTWLVTDVGRVPRTPYVAVLTLVTLGLGTGYLVWSGATLTELVTSRWGWGIVAGMIAGLVVSPGVRRLTSGPRPHGVSLVARFLWEGVVYGTAEAILLATLPVLAVWNAAVILGWTDTTRARASSGALAIAGALLVIGVHHLGYREFRGRAARPKLMGALVGCGVQALAFLLTGNLLAPIIAHIVLHSQMILRGIGLPPAAVDERHVTSPPRPTVTDGLPVTAPRKTAPPRGVDRAI
jgi:hypothetical protein